MRAARDTFLHFIADNLSDLNVCYVRVSKDDPKTSQLKADAINISFLDETSGVLLSNLTASIDLIYEDESETLDVADRLRSILQIAAITPKLNYAVDTANPFPTGTNLMWNPNTIRFRPIPDPFGFRLNCALAIRHHTA